MKDQPHRLPIGAHLLGGSAIDRTQPLQFRLDGRTIAGFAGDTVLSAVLAAGIDCAGLRGGYPLALSARFAPPIAFAALAADPQRALPMARAPAIDGAEFRTLAPGSRRPHWLSDTLALVGRRQRSLGLDLDRVDAMAGPWLDIAADTSTATDTIVVGGGVAGMTAALAAAKAGHKVVLIEAAPVLGGAARFFGSQEGEESPDQSVTRLAIAVTAADAITVLLRAEAIAVRPGAVRVHMVGTEDNSAAGQILDFTAPRIVLATGALERLPVFPGNRLPGVVSALEAFQQADRYGVWPGRSALLATVSSAAYRLAMRASDAGITLHRIADGRPDPRSRFIEFAKAYGIAQSAGMVPARAEPAGKGAGLSVTLQLAIEGLSRLEEPLDADALIVCGGWQPDLSLWHMTGGQSRWNPVTARLDAALGPKGIVLAGSAAGYLSKQACLASGKDAIKALLGRDRTPIVELVIDPIYETPDAPAPMASFSAEPGQPSYLDAGTSAIARPGDTRPRWRRRLPFAPAIPAWSLADQPQALSLGDVAAGVQLGAIPAASAGIVAQERAAVHGDAVDSPSTVEPQRPLVPAYLAGRFGSHPQLWSVSASEPRSLELGALIFINSDQSDPRQAIGAIVRTDGETAIAIIGKPGTQPGEGATLREQGGPVAIRMLAPYAG